MKNEKLIQWRKHYGFSQAVAADLVGIPLSTFQKVERRNFEHAAYIEAALIVSVATEISFSEMISPSRDLPRPRSLRRKQYINRAFKMVSALDPDKMCYGDSVYLIAAQDKDVAIIIDAQDIVDAEMATLPMRLQIVLSLRFGLDGAPQLTLAKCGKLLGVTRESVRQMEIKAIRELSRHWNYKQK